MTQFAATLRLEAEAINAAIPVIADTYAAALPHILCRSPILFSGMGKSGHIAAKAASTMRSLGVPSHYVHPGDASHGDLGAITGDSVLVLISNSGNTPELADMIFFCRDQKVPIIAITGDADSPLGRAATATICYGKVKEACPNGLAPTTSTTVCLAICDALAVDAAEYHKVTPAIFKTFHPGGKLGARLKAAREIMRPIPHVAMSAPLSALSVALSAHSAGICAVLDKDGLIAGVITDGDLRRASELKFTVPPTAKDLMVEDPLCVPEDMRAEDVHDFMQNHRITKVLVEAKSGDMIGFVNLHDTN